VRGLRWVGASEKDLAPGERYRQGEGGMGQWGNGCEVRCTHILQREQGGCEGRGAEGGGALSTMWVVDGGGGLRGVCG